MPTISIVIPVYNVEKYLRRCLDSCVNQTFRNIEIIVVNDYSPDNSDVIMREYEEKYPELIKCIYLDKNMKQGGARNRGIEIVQGEYIIFVDSDDWIDKDMCEKMYKSAINNNADLVICDFYRIFENHKSYRNAFSAGFSSKTNVSAEELLKNNLNVSPCNKMIRKSVIQNSMCYFPENAFYEDLAVTWVWFLVSDIINYINEPLYNYYYNINSTTNHNSDIDKTRHHINAIIKLINNFDKTGLLKKYNLLICQFILRELYVFFVNFFFENDDYLDDIDELIYWIKMKIFNWEYCLNNDDLADKFEKQTIRQLMKQNDFFYKSKRKNLLMRQCKISSNQIVVWGNGIWGRKIVRYLKSNNVRINYIVDNSEELCGTYSEDNIPIVSFDEVKDKCDIIIVSIKGEKIYNEIKAQIKSANPDIEVKYFMELFLLED